MTIGQVAAHDSRYWLMAIQSVCLMLMIIIDELLGVGVIVEIPNLLSISLAI